MPFFFYIEAAARQRAGFPHLSYVFGAIFSFVLALGSKETAMTFPLALLLWDVAIRRLDGAALRRAFLSDHLPFWLVLLPVVAWAWWHPRYAALAQFSFGIRPLWDNLLSELHAVTYALLLFICPWKQNFDHDLPVLHSLLQWPLPLDLLVWCVLAVTAFVSVRRFPLLSFGIGWFVLQMLPTTVIPRNDLLSERNLYLASIGFLLMMVFLGSHLTRQLVNCPPATAPHPSRCRSDRSHSRLLSLCLHLSAERTLSRSGLTLVRLGREIAAEGEAT